MVKPLQDIIFREVNGKWIDPLGNLLADFLAEYDIIVDDRCQFARLYDYKRMVLFYYRASHGKVQITLWRIYKT